MVRKPVAQEVKMARDFYVYFSTENCPEMLPTVVSHCSVNDVSHKNAQKSFRANSFEYLCDTHGTSTTEFQTFKRESALDILSIPVDLCLKERVVNCTHNCGNKASIKLISILITTVVRWILHGRVLLAGVFSANKCMQETHAARCSREFRVTWTGK